MIKVCLETCNNKLMNASTACK